MKRWIGALIAVAIACLSILLNRATSPDLLRDTDTKVLLATVRERNAPFSWFTGDWPLQNHFYRPVSTLAFELDSRLYGNNAVGYALTNALLCVACVLLLFWFLRELTDRPIVAGGAAVLFALQHVGYQRYFIMPLYCLAILAAVIGILRHRLKIQYWLPTALVIFYAVDEVWGIGQFGPATVGWLPGRTATVMTVFALIAMASYARYERLGSKRIESQPTAIDLPATKSSRVGQATKPSIFWPILSLIAIALAFGSYEQAVMLPAVMLAVAVTMRASRMQVRWAWQAGFWALLVAYLLLRRAVIPAGVSHYQAQQFRHGPGVYLSLLAYAMPFANSIPGMIVDLQTGPLILMTGTPYAFVLGAASNLTAFYQARRRWVFALAGYGMSCLAFLPMAWVKQFGHYNYWPMALRSLFTVTVLWVGYDLLIIAWSPPTRQARPRPDPAPGSLPHP